jgi:hypothetical protein
LQAPSFRLEQYIQQQQKPPTTASDAAGSIHKAINTLRAAVATQQKLLSSLTDTCEQYQEAVLSQQLTGTSIATSADTADVTGAGTTTDTNSHQQVHEAAAAASAGEQSAADLLNVRIRGSDPAAAAAAAAAATAVKFEPEEVALLMGAVTAGLQQDLEWMVSTKGLAPHVSAHRPSFNLSMCYAKNCGKLVVSWWVVCAVLYRSCSRTLRRVPFIAISLQRPSPPPFAYIWCGKQH